MWYVCVWGEGSAVDSEMVFQAGPMFWLLAICKVLILTSLSDNVRTPSLRKKQWAVVSIETVQVMSKEQAMEGWPRQESKHITQACFTCPWGLLAIPLGTGRSLKRLAEYCSWVIMHGWGRRLETNWQPFLTLLVKDYVHLTTWENYTRAINRQFQDPSVILA